jgi:hypothetical protein
MEHNWSGQGVKELALLEDDPPKDNRPTAPHAGGGAPAGIDPNRSVASGGLPAGNCDVKRELW